MVGLRHYADDQALVRKVCVGPMENNAYVVACRATGAAVLIDAAAEPERLLVITEDVDLTAILTTHGHRDHVQGVTAIREATGVPFRIHPVDAVIAGHVPDDPLAEGVVRLGDLVIEVLATPGHTAGSTCFAMPGIVFTGDTLFPGGPGATADAAAFATVLESIERRLFSLDPDTLVMPGHGLDTTIGAERPHLEEWRARGW